MFEIFEKGGLLMIPLGICSVVALTIILERFFNLRWDKVFNLEVMDLISSLIEEQEYQKAVQICKKNSNGITNVMAAGLECHQKSKEEIREAIADAGRQEIADLEKNLPVLGTIAGIAPLIGLLGTVTGMIKVFKVISIQGMGQASTLAGGISEALITTATGLMIAIPSLVAYNYFVRKAEKIILKIERHSSRLLSKFSN